VNVRAILFVVLSFIILMVSVLMRPAPNVGVRPGDQVETELLVDESAVGNGETELDGADSADGADGVVGVVGAVGKNDAASIEAIVEKADTSRQKSEDNKAEGSDDQNSKDDVAGKTSVDSGRVAQEDGVEVKSSPVVGLGVTDPLEDSQIEDLIESRRPARSPQKNALLNSWSYRAQEMQGDLTTIGSLAPDSGQRYLITANSLGGTIRRIELNHRKENGRHFYRDLEITYGYIGSLDCFDASEGCKIGIVGAGTPADIAGLKRGDVVNSVGGVDITSKYELETALAKTLPGDDVEINITRDGEPSSVVVKLGEKPIELIRPEPGMIDPTRKLIESFSLSLMKPSEDVNEMWDALGGDMLHRQWDVRQTNIDGSDAIEFTYTIQSSQLQEFEVAGPLRVVKRYILPKFEPTEELKPSSFHWNFEIEVYNDSNEAQKLGYSLIGPTGTPSETWWYANKIYGGGGLTGIGGARDVTASLPEEGYVFAGNADVIKNLNKKPPEPTFVISPYDTVTTPEKGRWNWVGIDAQYFNITMINKDQTSLANNINAVGDGAEVPKNSREQRLVDCTSLLFEKFDVPAGGSVMRSFQMFAGPKEKEILSAFGLDDNRAFGWFWWCSKPLLWLLHVFYFLTGSFSYGIPIIMLTILVRCFMIPFSRKAALNAQMMQALQPKMKEITDKYEDLQERGAAQRELFAKHNYNPLGGCLVMFIQLPIFLGLYRGLSVDIALRDQALIPGLAWCSDLSAPDKFMYWKDWMPAALGAEGGWLGPYLNILPLITMVLFLVQQKLFTPPAMDDQQKMMQKMMGFMMIFMGVMFFKVPSGLCLYFITSSIWGILERKLLPKPKLDTDSLDLDAPVTISKAARKKMDQEAAKVEEKRQRNADRKRELKKRNEGR